MKKLLMLSALALMTASVHAGSAVAVTSAPVQPTASGQQAAPSQPTPEDNNGSVEDEDVIIMEEDDTDSDEDNN